MKNITPISHKLFVFCLIAVAVVGFSGMPFAVADDYYSEISQLQQENEKNEKKVIELEDQALGYKDAINKLAAQIDTLQSKIDENTRQKQKLEQEIKVAEAELNVQKELLGQNIRIMYLNGDMSTLEMLASSKDLSEFVDKEQYRNVVRSKIQLALEKIQELRLKLRTQKDAISLLIKDQEIKRTELDTSRQKQSDLLAYNKSQIENFNQKTTKNRERISQLIAEQKRANFNPDGGYYFIRFDGYANSFNAENYPYRTLGFSMQLGPCSNVDEWPDSPDKWGYCTRQCVSYAAWAVEASGRIAPKYWGNAVDWVAAAYANGVPVYRQPKAGDIAISTSGYWGHAMYVESVSGNSFTTTEYNTYLDGRLTRQTRNF